MPYGKPAPTALELFELAQQELERSVNLPDIRSYKPWGAQIPFHHSSEYGRILTAGNQKGKTASSVCELIWMMTDTHPFKKRPEHWGHGAIKVRGVVVDIEKGVNQIAIPEFRRWTPRKWLIDGSFEKSWDPRRLILTLSNGSQIDFLTYKMELDKFGGVQRHIIWFDEEPPRDIFNESMMRLKRFDGWWIISATPVNGMDWIYDKLVEPVLEGGKGKEIHVEVFQLTGENPYLVAKDNTRFSIAMDSEEISIREEGKYVAKSGLVFPFFSKETHVAGPFDRVPGSQIYSSTDHGYNNPTAWLWHEVRPNGSIHTFGEHYADHIDVQDHAKIVRQREQAWGLNSEAILRTGDPAMGQHTGLGTSVLQTYAMEGLFINVENVPKDPAIGIDKMQQYFKLRGKPGKERPMWTISPNCPNLIRELKKLRWESYESSKLDYKHNRKEAVHKKDDHAFDSAKYFATFLPNLTPDTETLGYREEPKTISFSEMMAKLSEDPDVEFVDRDTSTYISYEERYADYG